MTLLAGTNFVLHAAGWLEGGLVSSYEKFMIEEGIPVLDATSNSVEELATTILHEAKLVRRIY